MSRRSPHLLLVEDSKEFGPGFIDSFEEAYSKLDRQSSPTFDHWPSVGAAESGLRRLETAGGGFDVAFCDFWLHDDKKSLERLKLDISPKSVDKADGIDIATKLLPYVGALAIISATRIFHREPAVVEALEQRFAELRARGRFTSRYKLDDDFSSGLARWVLDLQLLRDGR